MKQRNPNGETSLGDLAAALWRGLPLLWQEELRLFELYEAHVGQELTREGLELWMTRVQAGECPVAGSACDKPRGSRFCAHHRPGALPGM
jgi:hypothetical protein